MFFFGGEGRGLGGGGGMKSSGQAATVWQVSVTCQSGEEEH